MMSEEEGQRFDCGRWRHFLVLLAILGVALCFRLIPIPWGIGLFWWDGDYFQPDEMVITKYVESFPKSLVPPQRYSYPTGVHHIDSVLFQIYKVIRSTYGDLPPIMWVKGRFTERQQVYLMARTVNALMGVLSCLFVYLVLQELTLSRKHALWGAFLMNCMPYPVLNAAFATTDVPSSLIAAWVFYEYVRARKRDQLGRLGYQARVGILAGCGMAVKYTNLFLLVPLTLLPFGYVFWKKQDPMRWMAGTAAMLAAALVSLLVLMPAIVFDPERVGSYVRRELNHSGSIPVMTIDRLIQVFSSAFGWPMLLIALVACPVVFARWRRPCVEMIIFVGSFLALCGSGLIPRYLITIAPFVAILIGLAWHTIQGASRTSSRRFGWAFVAGVGSAVVLVIACLYGRYAYDTRIQATRYIVDTYQSGTTLGAVKVGNLYSQYMPKLPDGRYTLQDGLLSPQVLVLSERNMSEMSAVIKDPEFLGERTQHFNSSWGNGPPNQDVVDFYSDILAGQSPYRFVRKIPQTRLPLEFCGFSLYLYENSNSAPARGPHSVLMSWNFTELAQDKWQWEFPGGSPVKNVDGANYSTSESQAGPRLRGVAINAADATRICVKMALVKDLGNGETAPASFTKLVFYYGNSDTAPDKAWPFSLGQAITLAPVIPEENNVFDAKLTAKTGWQETFNDFFFDVHVVPLTPEEQSANVTYGVTVSKIELLK